MVNYVNKYINKYMNGLGRCARLPSIGFLGKKIVWLYEGMKMYIKEIM